MPFPQDFIWGTAAASYQIEGATKEGGRGECIWERFSHTPGKVFQGHTGEIACDHYHRYPEDVALMKSLGMDSYRFSISWARIQPTGEGAVNQPGLDFYNRLVDEIIRAGMTPAATMYHWDLPQALQDKGGWTNSDMPKWFTDYADIITKSLGDRVKFWITLNEPWCTSMLGYKIGVHAPGITDIKQAYKAAHQTLLTHAAAVAVVRENVPDAQVGITLNLSVQEAASDDPEDVRLARIEDGTANRWFLDPLYKGEYPADIVTFLNEQDALEGIDLSEVKAATVKTDFLGINYYMRFVIKSDPDQPGKIMHNFPADADYTDMGWEIYPDGLYQMLMRVHNEYHPPAIYITENGAAFPEPEHLDPNVEVLEDPRRVDFLKGYIGAVERAVDEGAPVKGYYVWSFMDNFEWGEGYNKRFGIVHVDYETQKRTPKRSALYFSQLAQSTIR